MSKAICSLNFMYSMERFATEIYRGQRGAFSGADIAEKMKFAQDNEQQHVEKLSKQIVGLKNVPTKLSIFFWLTGKFAGYTTRCLGKKFMLKTDILVEKRAVKDYGYFLRTMHFGEDTKLLLKGIISDEEEHVKNWAQALSSLKGSTQ